MDINKPRIAIYYHVLPVTGMRNDGAPGFINYNLHNILDGVGDMSKSDGNVVHLWPNKEAEKFGKFDLHVWVDYGEDALSLPCDWYPPSPSAYWVSDAHLGYKYRMETAKKFDFVFVAQKEFIDQFVADGISREKIFYLPHAFEPIVYKPLDILKKWDWCFIGHLNSEHRINLLDAMCKEFPNWYLGWRMGQAPGFNSLDDACYKICQSRVGVNYSIKKDLNMRVFETLGTKTCLLTDNVPDIHDFFTDGKHLVLFDEAEDAIHKMRDLLNDEEKRISIAEAGYQEAISKHTYMHRALEILNKSIGYVPEVKILEGVH